MNCGEGPEGLPKHVLKEMKLYLSGSPILLPPVLYANILTSPDAGVMELRAKLDAALSSALGSRFSSLSEFYSAFLDGVDTKRQGLADVVENALKQFEPKKEKINFGNYRVDSVSISR